MFILNFLSRHSAIFMILACVVGFLLPDAAHWLLGYLPQILFFLMFFTLLGMSQPRLVSLLSQPVVWQYALLHSVGMTIVFVGLAYAFGIRGDLLLAIAATTATSPLFGTSAIVRSIGFSPLLSMGLTIAATLLMPLVLYVNLHLFQSSDVSIDMVTYIKRLLIFIIGPMALSALVHHWVSEAQLHRVHQQLSKVTIVLVMTFPFGLIGDFRTTVDQNPAHAAFILCLSSFFCLSVFAINYVIHHKHSVEHRISAAVAGSGRNLVLTISIAGAFLGTEFMPLVGAMQLPTYALPLLAKYIIKRRHTHV